MYAFLCNLNVQICNSIFGIKCTLYREKKSTYILQLQIAIKHMIAGMLLFSIKFDWKKNDAHTTSHDYWEQRKILKI